MQYYNRKPDDRYKKQLRHRYRYSRRRPIDTRQRPTRPIRAPDPPPSSPASRYAAGYAPARSRKEPATAPPFRGAVMNTDPELPRVTARQNHVPHSNQADTQKLPPGENDGPSLGAQLEGFALEIERAFRRMRPRARLVTMVILICLFLILHLWLQVLWLLLQMLWQALASWINPIYLLFGIIASAIVIYEFVRQFFENK